MRLLLRALSLIALLLGWLTVAPTGPAVTAAACAAAPTYSYDTLMHGETSTSTTTVRGPPTARDSTSICNLVDHPSCGAVVCPNVDAAPASFTYDRSARHMQVASAGSWAEHRVRPSLAPSSASDRNGVAAETGEDGLYAYRGVGRDHPGYDDALQGKANPRDPNGSVNRYGFPAASL